MDKEEYLKYAIDKKFYKKQKWMISAFSVTSDASKETLESKDPFVVLRMSSMPYFFNVDGELVPIKNADKGPLFSFRSKITATKEMCPNIDKPIETTIGRLLFNLISIVHSFGTKIPYLNESIDLDKIDSIITDKLHDDTEDRNPNFIYVSEYKEYVNTLYYWTNFTQISVWALTEKLITPPPGIDKYRNELLKKYGNNITDPVALANFEQELIKLDSEYLKDDQGGQFFQSGGKARNIVRKKLFLTLGAESGLTEGRTRRPVVQSLKDGWTPKDMPALIEALRAGSYNRGKRTALGGELTKWLFRASTGIEITEEDCKTAIGQRVTITKSNYKNFISKYRILKNSVKLIASNEEAEELIGQNIEIRSPLFCHTKDNNFCSVCVGKDIANNKDGVSLAIAEIGSMFLLMKMKQIHGKSLTTAKIDLDLVLN
jgi:hypothetical protein